MKPRQPASTGQGAKPGRMSSDERRGQLPATALRCRICWDRARRSRPSAPARAASRLSIPSTTGTPSSAPSRARRSRPGRVDLALRAAAPGRRARRAPTRAGPDAARPGAAAGRGARHRRALAQARHGEPDALLQGPRRRRRGREGAGARAARRSPARRPATSPAPSPRARPPRGSTPRSSARPTSSRRSCSRQRSTAPTIYAVRGNYDALQPADGRALLRARRGRS